MFCPLCTSHDAWTGRFKKHSIADIAPLVYCTAYNAVLHPTMLFICACRLFLYISISVYTVRLSRSLFVFVVLPACYVCVRITLYLVYSYWVCECLLVVGSIVSIFRGIMYRFVLETNRRFEREYPGRNRRRPSSGKPDDDDNDQDDNGLDFRDQRQGRPPVVRQQRPSQRDALELSRGYGGGETSGGGDGLRDLDDDGDGMYPY